ncbi:MAG TPA: dienelactone hydrolase family protein [Gammaproteobacteria bacterium]|nr:dienelactone hydrolase family protein [Gammaproteobacteria bacterium]
MRIVSLLLALGLLPVNCVWGAGMDDVAYAGAMAAMHAGDAPVASPAAEVAPAQPVQGRELVYATVNGKPVHGYLARPKHARGPLPGIIVIHEWWGLNDNIRHMADRLAGEGYAALAVDLYGGHAATTSAEAQRLMKSVFGDTAAAESNLRQAYAYLHDAEHAPRIGVIGWCFGGGWSLQTALMLPDKIDATVMYYGRPVDDVAALSKLKMPLIGFFGEEDHGITVKDVQTFQQALKQAGVKAEIHEYPHAGHAFANPSGKNYQADAARDAWRRTVNFLAQYLKGGA